MLKFIHQLGRAEIQKKGKNTMEFDYSKIVEVFESKDYEQINKYLKGGWKHIGFNGDSKIHVVAWIDSENEPQHYPSSWDLLAEHLKDLDDQEHISFFD